MRTIEHGNLVDAPTAKLMAEKGMYMIPNLVDLLRHEAAGQGVRHAGGDAGEERRGAEGRLRRAGDSARPGVQIAYGTDLLGALQDEQTGEFKIRGEVMPADRDHPLGDR